MDLVGLKIVLPGQELSKQAGFKTLPHHSLGDLGWEKGRSHEVLGRSWEVHMGKGALFLLAIACSGKCSSR